MLATFRTNPVSSARSQDGFTLVELLVVMAMLPIVVTALLLPVEFGQRETPKTVEYTKAVSDATTGLQRMLQEIRQAYKIDFSSEYAIEFNAVINDSDLQIFYKCDEAYPTNIGNKYASEYTRCQRVSVATGGSLPSISSSSPVVIDRLLNKHEGKPVFTFNNAIYPTYVQAQIRVPARGPLNSGLTHTIELHNGTDIPNLANGN
jgi:prepilin-type N-terminal cleavage/methylation domain-containing protein